jgi:hypothetical protein
MAIVPVAVIAMREQVAPLLVSRSASACVSDPAPDPAVDETVQVGVAVAGAAARARDPQMTLTAATTEATARREWSVIAVDYSTSLRQRHDEFAAVTALYGVDVILPMHAASVTAALADVLDCHGHHPFLEARMPGAPGDSTPERVEAHEQP